MMFDQHIVRSFLDVVKKYPQHNAFCFRDTYFTYAEFVQRIVAIAKSLEHNKETKIGLITNDDLDTYAAIIAIWFTGKIYVPLNPDAPVERNQIVIDAVALKTILNSEETEHFKSEDDKTSTDWLASYTSEQTYGNQLAYIFFTSGSTGTPKGVMISKESVSSFVEAFEALGLDISEKDRCLQMFDLTFDLSVMSYLIPLLKGACVYTIPKDEIKYGYIFELMEEKELTVSLMVPSVLNFLRPYFDEIDCPKMRYSLFCGEALKEDVVSEWANCLPNARIDNVYGPTENTIFCTNYTFDRTAENDSLHGVLSIGKPMLNNLTVVFDDNNQPAKVNETGELCLAGNQLTDGYFQRPELNETAFFNTEFEGEVKRFYRTGDLCVLRDNGNIDYIGRKDFQVKIQGFRIELSEIEYHSQYGIENKTALIAIALENKMGNTEIALVFETSEFDTKKLKTYLKSKVPGYMLPSKFYFMESFPLNVNGKIDRKSIKKRIQEG